ncbi:Gamma-secretase subunit Aph-1 [Orchesella cincta]|uniref:Gamma-secretase subunit Aph-1 n=1 Tax=Orchesella cincta TaxID=48709 RepID=A0A1D2MCU5_ORCCI|nr:Gamma-secretase subunit Aph-1 [Orchesella cincta]
MAIMEFFGCSFIAFGPPFAMFRHTVAHDPVRIIILIASSFFWLLSLLLSSMWWALLKPYDVPLAWSVGMSIVLQHILRFLVYRFWKRVEWGLKLVADRDSKTGVVDNKKYIIAYVSGLGFGIMSGAFAFINILAESLGPGTVGIRGAGDSPMFFVTYALTTLCFILLHTSWNVIFHAGMNKRNYGLTFIVIVSHFAASSLTFFNKDKLYWASILPNYFNLLVSGWLAFRCAGGRLYWMKSEHYHRLHQL